jgi:hypothetical protein
MEGGGNAGLILYQRRVLLEVFDQKRFIYLSYFVLALLL